MTQPQNTQPQKKSRRALLEEFVAQHPSDAFALYGLAIECANQNDHAAAQAHFERLLTEHPDYVTGYFQYGQFLARQSRTEEARRMLQNGIEAARRTGDQHAASEMETALAQLQS
jgi:tetratricopeptide (TPR) repeat protein